jgi:alkylation response protein AidB-like acyl-CoA dehydrogenase
MRFPRSERQAEIVALAGRLAETIAPRAAEHDRDGTIAVESYRDLIAAGYHTLTVPAEYGGMGGSMLDFVLAQRALAHGDEAVALGINMHLMTVVNAGAKGAWPEALYARVMREVVEEGALINSAATEPELGSPSGGGLPRTTATPVEGGYAINGHKTFASLCPILRYFVISAVIGPPGWQPDVQSDAELAGKVEVGSFLVRNGPGVRIERTWDVMGMRATESHDIYLENCFVPASDVIRRQVYQGPESPPAGSAYFALGAAAVYLGIADAARDFAVAFARERVPSALGRPIATLPGVQRRVAEMDVLLWSNAALMLDVAEEWTDNPEARLTLWPRLAAAKYAATNAAIQVVDLAMRVVGGVALYRAHPLERYYRNVRAGLNHPPIDDRALDQIARAAFGATPPPPKALT